MLVLSYYLLLEVFKVIMEMKSSKCVVLKLNSAYFMFNFVYCIGVFNELVFDILQTLIYNALSATEKLSWEIIKSRDYYSIHLLHAFSLICINVCRRRKTTSEIFFHLLQKYEIIVEKCTEKCPKKPVILTNCRI